MGTHTIPCRWREKNIVLSTQRNWWVLRNEWARWVSTVIVADATNAALDNDRIDDNDDNNGGKRKWILGLSLE